VQGNVTDSIVVDKWLNVCAKIYSTMNLFDHCCRKVTCLMKAFNFKRIFPSFNYKFKLLANSTKNGFLVQSIFNSHNYFAPITQ
jgi:hypothetical protein